MQILLACAKNMTTRPELSPSILTKPKFLEEAERHALQLAAFTEAELGKALKCNPRLAILNKLRYLSFFDSDDSGPAVLSYNGIVYRHLRAWEFTEADYAYANNHLWICSFLYGLLRPMDRIKNYRLEGNEKLQKSWRRRPGRAHGRRCAASTYRRYPRGSRGRTPRAPCPRGSGCCSEYPASRETRCRRRCSRLCRFRMPLLPWRLSGAISLT